MPHETDQHKLIVQGILAEYASIGARAYGFARAIRAEMTADEADNYRDIPRPDAFIVDSESQTVIVFEVECSNPLSRTLCGDCSRRRDRAPKPAHQAARERVQQRRRYEQLRGQGQVRCVPGARLAARQI